MLAALGAGCRLELHCTTDPDSILLPRAHYRTSSLFYIIRDKLTVMPVKRRVLAVGHLAHFSAPVQAGPADSAMSGIG